MARPPTRLSRISVGFVDSAQSVVDVDAGDTGDVFSVTGTTTMTGDTTITGDVTVAGDLNVSSAGSLAVGGGTSIAFIQSSLVSIDVGSVAGNDSASSTHAVTGAVVGDVVILTPDSIWSGAYEDLNVYGIATAADTVDIIANNSAATAVDPDAMNFRVTLIRF